MKKLIASLFGGSSRASSSKPSRASSRDNPLTIEDGSDNATRRQLVQVLLRDALRRYGIPPRWVDCQMMLVSSRSRGPGMYVRLVVRQWDDRLMNYAFAFQSALMLEVVRFEPQAAQWLYGISWQLDVADTCPHRTMPEKTYWADPVQQADPPPQISHIAPVDHTFQAPLTPFPIAAQPTPLMSAATAVAPSAPRAAAASPDRDAIEDLERLFLVRDKELSRRGDGGPAVGYESTQPSAL